MKLYSLAINLIFFALFFTIGTIESPSQQNEFPKISDKPVKILFVGDLMLDRAVKSKIDKNGFDYLFEPIIQKNPEFFTKYELIHANLEGAVGNYRRKTSKEIAFNFETEDVMKLHDYGFNIFTLANNHSYDMGKDAFEETKANLADAGFDYYGKQYGVDKESMIIKEINNRKIAFIGANDTNSPVDQETIVELIQRVEKEAEFTILNIHWGNEYKLQSNARQQKLAEKFINAGADMIIGHHPHVVEELAVINGKPVFYSLGNFIFDQYFSEDTQIGLGVEINIKNNELEMKLIPFESNKSQLSLIQGKKAEQLIKRIVPGELPKEYNFGAPFIFPLTK